MAKDTVGQLSNGIHGLFDPPPSARQVALVLLTTGISLSHGHRIIEVAAEEISQGKLTENPIRFVVDPERAIDPEVSLVTGYTNQGLEGMPAFEDVAPALVDYLRGADLVVLNGIWEIEFLDHELSLARLEPLKAYCEKVLDVSWLGPAVLGNRSRMDLTELCAELQVPLRDIPLEGAPTNAKALAMVYLSIVKRVKS
jgi:DNA polymerase III subunit epsilon